ncbi:MAG: hypothetical protein C0608_05510 [Deltaproteobacteria bacterium]|nr:MAG: hypothetical protein C0608_05510 [Deltaproteobacteria bacterium]
MRAGALLLLVAILLGGCGTSQEPATGIGGEGEGASQTFTGLTMEGLSPKGDTRWLLRAKSASADTFGKVGDMVDVEVEVTDARGRVVALSEGCDFMEDTLVNLTGAVSIMWDRYKAVGRDLSYDLRAGMITSDSKVKMTGEGFLSVEGDGLSIEVKKRIARINDNVHAIFTEVSD